MGESESRLGLHLCGLGLGLHLGGLGLKPCGLGLWSHGLGLHTGGLGLTLSPGESGERYTRHIFKLLHAIMDKNLRKIIRLVSLFIIVIHLYLSLFTHTP